MALAVFEAEGRRLVYATHGRLDPDGCNCVLLPSYYTGTHASYLPMIGAGRALDPTRWFIVAPNMFGNGVSSSPSNERDFVPTTVRDNVRLQAALLEALGVKRIALIYGWSMGAMQGYEWAAAYPEIVGALLAVCGSARCWPLNQVFLEGIAAALRAAATPEAGKRTFGRAYAGWAYCAQFYRDELYRDMGFSDLESFLQFWEDDHAAWHADDLLAMLWTWQSGDADLSRIKARTIVMPADTDMYFPLDEARIETAAIFGAECRPLYSAYGHCAGAPGRFPTETRTVENAIKTLLMPQP